MPTQSIALIGDYDPDVHAHRAIPWAISIVVFEFPLRGPVRIR